MASKNKQGGKKVLITRQFEQAGGFINLLSDRGHFPYLLPMIETCQLCPHIEEGVYEVIIFTSANAVKYFAPYNDNVRGLVYIAVGPKTASAMENFLGISADKTPTVHNVDGIKSILSNMNLKSSRILSPGAKERSELSLDELDEFEATILTPAIYETNFAEYPRGYVDSFVKEHGINTITLCSPSAAKSFFSQYRSDVSMLDILSIGTTTAEYIKSLGILTRFPDTFTVDAMVDII